MAPGPPLGDSEAGAAIVSTAFFVLSFLCIRQFRATAFRLYMIGGALAGIMRGVAYAIRASTISKGHADEGESVCVLFFSGAGFGIAIAIQLLIICGWLKNTPPHLKMAYWSVLRVAVLLLFPCVIVFGPILGLAAGLLLYEDGSPSAVDNANKLRKASGAGMFIIASASLLVALLCSWVTLQPSSWSFSLRKHANIMILCVVPGALLLVWAASFRIASIFTHPEIAPNEQLYYPLQVLPEILQLATWAIPTLYARIHLSTRFEEWWKQMHPDGPGPAFGFAEHIPSASTGDALPSQPSTSIGSELPKADAAVTKDVLAAAV